MVAVQIATWPTWEQSSNYLVERFLFWTELQNFLFWFSPSLCWAFLLYLIKETRNIHSFQMESKLLVCGPPWSAETLLSFDIDALLSQPFILDFRMILETVLEACDKHTFVKTKIPFGSAGWQWETFSPTSCVSTWNKDLNPSHTVLFYSASSIRSLSLWYIFQCIPCLIPFTVLMYAKLVTLVLSRMKLRKK